MKKTCKGACLLSIILIAISTFVPVRNSWAQNDKLVKNKHPKIIRGPYLTAPTQTSIAITWKTNMLAHSKVKYGIGNQLDKMAEPQVDGFIPVDSLHTIILRNLEPGQSYNYRVISTGVADFKPYKPVKTQSVQSPIYSFSTTSSEDSLVSFSLLTDSQYENVDRLNANLDLINWQEIDFLVHDGDALSWVQSEKQIFEKFLSPISKRLAHVKPFVYARGNHEMRGQYGRKFKKYVPNGTGKYYYAFDAGPVHFMVLDTGEDKSDEHEDYGGLNDLQEYRKEELNWFKKHVQNSSNLDQASFQVILMHAPQWGWVDGEKEKWTEVANSAGVDLVIAGHWHRFEHVSTGKYDNDFPILVVDQDQIAHVKSTKNEIKVVVRGEDNKVVGSFSINNQ